MLALAMISLNERFFRCAESAAGAAGAGRLTSGRESGALLPFELVPPTLDWVDVVLDGSGGGFIAVERGCAVPV